MEVRRLNPEEGFIREFNEYRNRVKSLETKPAGNITIRETLITTDPDSGVSTIIGQLPDGSYGFEQFIGDTEPPPVATAPTVSAQPGVFIVGWNGSFFGNAAQPRDFTHLNVNAQKMVSGNPSGSPIEVGVIRLQLDTVFVSTDICAVGETWRFFFTSEDYNGNISAASANSATVTFESAVTDAGINEALEGIAQDILLASSKAASAQNAAEDAQEAADLANNKVLDIIQSGAALNINGNFEQPNNLGWQAFSGTQIGTSTGTARSGTKVLYGALSSGNRWAYTDYINSGTTRTFYVEYWVRLRETLVAGNEGLSFGAWFSSVVPGSSDSVAAVYAPTDPLVVGYSPLNKPLTMGELSTNTWQRFATIYTTTASGITKTRFGPRIPGTTLPGNTVEIDDFRVIEITESFNAQTKADQAFNQAVSAASAAGSAQTSANSKNRVWYTGTAPAGTGHQAGDTWYDTSNGNRIHVWTGPTGSPANAWVNIQDTAIRAAQQAATGAQASADGKVTNYYQTSKPTGGSYKAGDQWYDTDDSYKLYVYVTTPAVNGVSNDWVPFADGPIAEIKNNVTSVTITATGALNIAQGKNKNYVGSSAPTPSANNVVGDIWIDTANSNLIKRWSGTNWDAYRDTTIAAANVTATAAYQMAGQKNQTFIQGTTPSAVTIGDLWIDTSNNNQMKRASSVGTGGWVDVRDGNILAASNAASAAMNTANGKNKVVYSTSPASGTGYLTGDTWFQKDATTGHIKAQWEYNATSNTWVSRQVQDEFIANITGGKIVVGTLEGDRLVANSVQASKLLIGAGSNMLVDPAFLNDSLNTLRIGSSSWTVSSSPSEGNLFYSNSTGANNDLLLYNDSSGLFTVDPTGEYSVILEMDGPAQMQAYLILTYTDGTAASGPTVKTFTSLTGAPVGARSFYSVSWKMSDYESSTNQAPVKTAALRIRRTSTAPAGTPTRIYSAKFGQKASGELLVDGAITAGSAIIAEAAISSAQISSLNAAKVSASWLESGNIKSGAIQVQHLAVSDLTNFAPSIAESPTDWTNDSPIAIVDTTLDAYDKKRLRLIDNTGTAKLARGPLMAVKAGDELYGEATVYRTGVTTNQIYIRYYYYDATKTYISSNATQLDGTMVPTNSASGTVLQVKSVAPAGAMYGRFVAVFTNATSNDIGLYNMKGYRRFGGQLIVDGAIVAGSAIIANGAIEDAQIKNLTITSGKVNEISADKLKSGFIDTNRLLAGSIGADKIVVGVGYNLAYNGSAQQFGASVGGTSDPTASTAGYTGWIRATSTPPTGFSSYWTSTAGQGTTNFLNAPAVPVKPNTNYRVNVWVKADIAGSRTYLEPMTGSTAAGHRITQPYPVPGTENNNPPTYAQMTYAFTNVEVPTVWTPWTVEFRTGTAPAQTMYFRWFVNHTNGTTTNSVFSFTGFELIEMTAGELLVNGAIKTQHMVAGTIDGGVISAGTLKALQIGAKEISVDKLLVTSTDNLIQEADFTGAGRGWMLASDATPNTGFTIGATTGRNSGPSLQVANSATNQDSWNSYISGYNASGVAIKSKNRVPAAGNQSYRVSAWVKSTVSVPVSGVQVMAEFLSSTNVATTASVVFTTPGTKTPATISANVWTEIFGMVTTPTDNVSITFGVSSRSNLSTGTLYVDFVSATRAANSSLIVDGSIVTDHMTAGSIDGKIITTETLSGAAIKGKSIQADRLVISSTDNLVIEADFTNGGSSWGLPAANRSIVATGGRGNGPALRVTGTTSLVSLNNVNNKIPVGAEDRFRGSFYVKSSAAATAGRYKLRLRPWTSTTTTATPLDVAVSPALSAGLWTLVEGYSPALPTTTIAVEFFLEATNAATGTTTDFDYVAMTRAADGKLVVDGAIDGKTITGATFRTGANVTTTGGVQFDLLGLRAYDPTGAQTFNLSAITGNVSSAGVFSTTSAQTVEGSGTLTIGASFGNFTYNSHTDYTGIPGIKFTRVHSTQGARAPASILYDGNTINISTYDPDATAFVPNQAAAYVSVGSGAVSMGGGASGATYDPNAPIPTLMVGNSGITPGFEQIAAQIDYAPSDNIGRTAGLYIDKYGSGYTYSGADRFYASLRSYSNQYQTTKLGQSIIEMGDGGIWAIAGERHTNGSLVSLVQSRGDGSGNPTGDLLIAGSNAVYINRNFATGGSGISITSTGTTITDSTTVNGTLTVSGQMTAEQTATFSNGLTSTAGTTALGASTTIAGVHMNYSNVFPINIVTSGVFVAYPGFMVPQYYRDSMMVKLTGVIGTNASPTITLAAATTYTVGTIPTAYRPSADILFSPLVGATMSPNIIFYVRANGNLQIYSPTAQTLATSAFYIGLDGMQWLRTA